MTGCMQQTSGMTMMTSSAMASHSSKSAAWYAKNKHCTGGPRNMCDVLDKVENRGIAKGIAKGKAEGKIEGEINIVTGLNAGADDYMPKPFSVLELIARVKANLRKKDKSLESEELIFGEIKVLVRKRAVFVNNNQVVLTQKEFDLLKLLVENAENAVSRETMLEEVWGVDYSMESRTIDMHIKSIRQKLNLQKENIVTVRGMGYKLTED